MKNYYKVMIFWNLRGKNHGKTIWEYLSSPARIFLKNEMIWECLWIHQTMKSQLHQLWAKVSWFLVFLRKASGGFDIDATLKRTKVTYRVTLRAIVTWWSFSTRRPSSTRWTSFSFLSSFSFGTLHNVRKRMIILQALNQFLNLSIRGQTILCCGRLSHALQDV